jgi:RHS repeat-associated protein
VRQVTLTYGPEGELLARAGSIEPETLEYDALYRLKVRRDGRNNPTTYAYHSTGYLAGVTFPGGDSTEYPLYDPAGNLRRRIEGRRAGVGGVQTDYLYTDPDGLLSDVQYPLSPGLNVHLTYDSYARLSQMTDGSGSHSRAYDDRDALASVTTTYTGLPSKTLSYSFYPDGSRQAMSTPAVSFTYSYSARGEMVGLTNPFGETFSWTYLDNGWLKTQQSHTAAHTVYSYDARGTLRELENLAGGAMGPRLSYFGGAAGMLHDAVGNRLSVTADLPGVPAYSGLTTYQYDTKDQLLQEQSARSGGYTNTFGYDNAGNSTTFKGSAHVYNANNQDVTNVYDDRGNPLVYRGLPLTFDAENRLTSAGGALLTAGYTGHGLRAWKQAAGGGRTYFLYDGEKLLLDMDAAGAVTAVDTRCHNGLLSRRAGGASVFYAFDPQGSVAQRLTAGGAVLTSHMFDAHGTGASSGATSDPHGYKARQGYYTDQETGLLLLTHRYYDPGTGRFLTRDPIGYNGGINLYAYVTNNPVTRSDPSGYGILPIVIVIVIISLAIAAVVALGAVIVNSLKDCPAGGAANSGGGGSSGTEKPPPPLLPDPGKSPEEVPGRPRIEPLPDNPYFPFPNKPPWWPYEDDPPSRIPSPPPGFPEQPDFPEE